MSKASSFVKWSENLTVKRRTFIKGLAFVGASAYAIAPLPRRDGFIFKNRLPQGITVDHSRDYSRRYDKWRIPNTVWGMVIDLAKCDGCNDLTSKGNPPRCTAACQEGHHAPSDYKQNSKSYFDNEHQTQVQLNQRVHEYIKVFKVQDNPWSNSYFFPRPCQQCIDPPCVHVCPVQAAWQRTGDRLTLVDQERCIGCRLCMAGCPYEVRFFHWEDNYKFYDSNGKPLGPDSRIVKDFEMQMPFEIVKQKGVIAKCDFCGNQFLGKLPHCVASCHKGALYFGNLLENSVTNNMGETILVDKTIQERKGFRWKEEEGTRPRVFYLPANTK